ncbi:MAG: tRNA (N(6)-L-threonylcarbamoyladenosine(37)-C(2))-methylthiotransferase MtaB [Thermodesulfobacteriota bacterium]
MPTENRKPKTENRLFHIITFGCKVNQCDSAGMAQTLAALGWSPAAPGTVPDLIIVNTCTVTQRADQQARQTLRRLAREHPGLPIWVTGCYAQRTPNEVSSLPGVQAVFGNQEKAGLSCMLASCQPNQISTSCSLPPLMGEGWGGGENPPPPSPDSQNLKAVNDHPAGMINPPLPPFSKGQDNNPGRSSPPLKKTDLGGFEMFPPDDVKGSQRWMGTFSASPPFHPWPVHPAPGQTRARLKIQEGCSHRCSYCIVPQVRGPRRSLEPEAVESALQELAALGYREVVLTGVDLGQYGLDHYPPTNLAALVGRLTNRTWPFRVRLSSLEPQMVTPELLEALAAWPNFCPHFHLPLQSGAAPVLAAMGRPYGPEEFRVLVHNITRRFPAAGLGLDVLVGFPGETGADFEATRTLVAELPVTYLHVFPYSPRPGTPAAVLKPLPGKIVRDRARIMRNLGQQKKQQFTETQLGQVLEVLVEGPAPQSGYLQGLSDHYLRVVFPGPPAWRNRLVKVRLLARQEEMLVGQAVGEP